MKRNLLGTGILVLVLCAGISLEGQSSVHVDGISKDYPGDVYTGKLSPDANRRDVRISDTKRTYQLTCNIENKACTAPEIGSQWQLVTMPKDKPEYLGDLEGEFPHQGVEVFLKTTNRTLGPYWMVAEMPLLRTDVFQRLIAECGTKEQGTNENDCTKWLARRTLVQKMNCSSTDTQTACHSFQELLKSTDPDLLDLFARLAHVYVCFRPREDTFFTLWFAEPSEWDWRKPNAEEKKLFELRYDSLMQFGSVGVAYYKQGIKDEDASMSGIGVWRYLPLTQDITPSSLARIASSSDAVFQRSEGQPTIQLDGARIVVSESYKNKRDENVTHKLLIQRSTGRFTETYNQTSSARTISEYSGQCWVVPNATD